MHHYKLMFMFHYIDKIEKINGSNLKQILMVQVETKSHSPKNYKSH
jgi:hypothetical protein